MPVSLDWCWLTYLGLGLGKGRVHLLAGRFSCIYSNRDPGLPGLQPPLQTLSTHTRHQNNLSLKKTLYPWNIQVGKQFSTAVFSQEVPLPCWDPSLTMRKGFSPANRQIVDVLVEHAFRKTSLGLSWSYQSQGTLTFPQDFVPVFNHLHC